MSEKESNLNRDNGKTLDESARQKPQDRNVRDDSLSYSITKMQSPDKWPDPPVEKNENKKD
jgi:hypothetical protein